MTNRILLFVFLLTNAVGVFAQGFKPTYQSNYSLDFSNFLSGVKYAYLAMDEKYVNYITNNPRSGNAQAIAGVLDYLKEIGFPDAKWGTYSNTPQNFSSLCELVRVEVSWGYESSTFTNITMTFHSCNNDVFKFVSEKNISVTGYTDIKAAFYNRCFKMYGYRKSISSNQRLQLPSEMTEWTEEKLKSRFQSSGADPI